MEMFFCSSHSTPVSHTRVATDPLKPWKTLEALETLELLLNFCQVAG